MRTLLALLFVATFLYAQENTFNSTLLLNHPSSTTLKQKAVELTLEYGIVNNTIDVFDIKSQEVSKERAESSFGDYDHLRLHLNIGLTDQDMLLLEFINRNINYGDSSIKARHYELAYRHSFASWLSFDLIFKGNEADNIVLTDVSDLNRTVHKIDPRLSIDKITPLYIWFYKTGDKSILVGLPYENRPYASLTQMYDYTASGRLTFGYPKSFFYPNLFIEAGYTQASTLADTNLFEEAPESITENIPQLPIDLSHSESYALIGLNTFITLPYDFGLYAEYNYQHFFRDERFTAGNNNHTILGAIDYKVTQQFIASVSGVYLHQQLNGVIPFLYNEQSQNSFDHKYGWANFSISYLW